MVDMPGSRKPHSLTQYLYYSKHSVHLWFVCPTTINTCNCISVKANECTDMWRHELLICHASSPCSVDTLCHSVGIGPRYTDIRYWIYSWHMHWWNALLRHRYIYMTSLSKVHLSERHTREHIDRSVCIACWVNTHSCRSGEMCFLLCRAHSKFLSSCCLFKFISILPNLI